MDTDRLGRDLLASMHLPLTGERRLIVGFPVALGAYVLWVGISGAALVSVAAVAGRSLSVEPWTTTTTLVVALATVLWILGPAAIVTSLLVGQVTNGNGNLEHYYRVQYPLVLVAVPLSLFGLVAGAGVVLGRVSGPMLAALVALGGYVLVRTLAYSYRVFSLSTPRAVQAFVFESAAVIAVAVLAGLADLVGQPDVVAVARAVDTALGTTGVVGVVSGTWTVAGVTVPALPALAAGFPVVLALTYVFAQTLVGAVERVRGVTVPRSQLRTGQRYPAFARPDADPTDRRETAVPRTGPPAGRPSSRADEGDTPSRNDGRASPSPGGEDRTGGTADGASGAGTVDDADRVSHTKVFTPPDDADLDAAVPSATNTSSGTDSPEPAGNDNTGGTGSGSAEGDGYECPACGETFSGQTTFAYCPTCGTELEPT